jgi:23S rRNA (pseudouridine1915-N3)-methyltransferase
VRLIAVSNKAPAWVDAGFREYAKRLSPIGGIELVELRPADRARGGNAERWSDDEAKRILGHVPGNAWVIALDERGTQFTSEALAQKLEHWLQYGASLTLVVGGPDGLGTECLARANERWSLSALTLPHTLVRILVAEQLYRAWSLRSNHPYHRA